MSANSQPWDYFPLPYLYAFTSVKKARKFVRNITGKRYKPSGKTGSFTLYEREDGKTAMGIILLKCHNDTPAQRYACLTHECVHYAQDCARFIGENTFSDEIEAYIVQSAMLACIDQIGKEWFNATPQT